MPLPPPPPGFTLDTPGASPGRPVIRKGPSPQGMTVQNGYVIDPNTATARKVEGLPPEAVDDEPGVDPTTASFYAQQILAGGQMPALGMGKAAAKARQEIMSEVARLAGAKGLSGTDLAKQVAHYKAGQKQVGTLETQLGTTQQNEQTALLNGQQFMDRSAELPGQTQIPIINSIVQTAQRHLPVPGHNTIAAMDAAWNTFVNEYAKVVSGTPTGGGVLSDSARHEAMKIMQGNYSLSQKQSAFEQMKADMANRLIAMNGTIDQAYDKITEQPGGRADAVVPGTPAEPEVNPIILGGDGENQGQVAPSAPTHGTRSVVDENRRALAEKIAGLMSKGADRNTILAFAQRGDPSLRADVRAWVDDALRFRQKHPGSKFSVDPGVYTSEVPLGVVEQELTRVGQTTGGAGTVNAADALTAGKLGDITGDQEATDRALQVAAAQHPNASLAGTMVGGATASLGGEAALARLGVGAGLGRALVSDAGYGAAAGSRDGLGGAAEGAGIGAVAGLGGNYLGRMGGSSLRGVTAPSVGYIEREIPGAMTIGQAVGQSGRFGKAVKSIEDRLSGLPVVGDAINARRIEGLQKLNVRAFDKALEPIGEKSGKFGEEAVADAQDKVGNAFRTALGGKVANVDHDFIADAQQAKAAINALPPRVAGEVNDGIDNIVKNYIDPQSLSLTGENLQPMLQELRDLKGAYYDSKDPLKKRIGAAIDQFSSGVESMFDRQAPDVMPAYKAAKKAQQRLYTLQDAVLRAKSSSKDGNALFTTGQLGMADRSSTINYGGKNKAAAGGGEFHDLQRNAQEVLPNKVPDSGTAGRLIVPAALLSAGAGADAEGAGGKGLTLAALISLAYSRAGQRALTAAVLKRGAAAKAAGRAVTQAAPLVGHATGSAASLGSTRD
jgi:hypothetical protein